jgi:acyl dehydratase
LNRKASSTVVIPLSAVGSSTPPVTVTVERGRLLLFAKATGQTDPLYLDVATARAQGHPDLPVPPTYLFGLELEQPDPFAWLRELGVDLNAVLHGGQSFSYDAVTHAGDTLTVQSAVVDVREKKGGALQFIERRSVVTRDGQPVATLDQTVVVRSAA